MQAGHRLRGFPVERVHCWEKGNSIWIVEGRFDDSLFFGGIFHAKRAISHLLLEGFLCRMIYCDQGAKLLKEGVFWMRDLVV